MTLQVMYFGMTAEATGRPLEQIEIEEQLTARELQNLLHQRYQSLSQLEYKLAVNRKIGAEDHPILPGDEIALLPPFAGG
jgi:molybdopterin converting factor small subunit